jgi:hypothetical protein
MPVDAAGEAVNFARNSVARLLAAGHARDGKVEI